jgi:omega-amidase
MISPPQPPFFQLDNGLRWRNKANMKIALCQMDIAWLDTRANLNKMKNYIAEAEAQDVKLLVFPEMALSGFCMDAQAVSLQLSSPEISELAAFTREKRVLVFAGAAIRHGLAFTNECLIIRNGEILTSYAKMNLFTPSNEDKEYSPGERLLTLEYDGFRITPLICFDTRFNDPFIRGARNGTDAFVIIASWPDSQSAHWKTLLSARAMDTQSFVIGVNRVGSGGGMNFAGESMVVAPSGKPMFEYGSSEKLMIVDVDLSYSRKLRTRFPVLNDQHINPKAVYEETLTLRG